MANYYELVSGDKGVKVAIIDGGFKGADKLSGDMPARFAYYRDYTGEGIYARARTPTARRCAEIIHDVAPEAELYASENVDDLVDLENAKDLCHTRRRIDIIKSFHRGWFLQTGIGDGRGVSLRHCK